MEKDKLLEEFKKYELERNSTHDARKFILGGGAGSPDTCSTRDGKDVADDCENDSSPVVVVVQL